MVVSTITENGGQNPLRKHPCKLLLDTIINQYLPRIPAVHEVCNVRFSVKVDYVIQACFSLLLLFVTTTNSDISTSVTVAKNLPQNRCPSEGHQTRSFFVHRNNFNSNESLANVPLPAIAAQWAELIHISRQACLCVAMVWRPTSWRATSSGCSHYRAAYKPTNYWPITEHSPSKYRPW